jgi:uncharacterized membrane protein
MSWVTLSIATAILISVEFTAVKKLNLLITDMDVNTFTWQCRLWSLAFLSMLMLYWNRKNEKKVSKSLNYTSWKYAAIVGLLTSASIVTFYSALKLADNPGYPTAVKEISLVLTFFLGAWIMKTKLSSYDIKVWLGLGLILFGVFLMAKYSCVTQTTKCYTKSNYFEILGLE